MNLFEESEELSFEDMLAIAGTEAAENQIALFAKKYFGKEMKDLTKEENHEIDCFGIYGISDWLSQND